MTDDQRTGRRILLFLNPRSRTGGDGAAEAAVRQLEVSGFAVTRVSPSEAADVSRQVQRHRGLVDLVVIGGGDGTLNGALAGLVDTGLPLGILPLGTANDLARTLGIPTDPAAAAAVIIAGHTRKIDVGQVNDRFFVNVASMGVGVELARRMTGNAKRHLGRLSYPLAAVQTLLSTKPFKAEVRMGTRTMNLRSVQLAVGNGVYYGGGMAVYEGAAIDDQCLDFYSIAPKRLWQWPFLLSRFQRGRNRDLAGMRAFCSSGPLEIRTDPPLAINTDGEITTTTPAQFRLLPRALAVFAPAVQGAQT